MHQRQTTTDSPTAMAEILALILANKDHSDSSGLQMMKSMDAFRRLGITKTEFESLVERCRERVVDSGFDSSWLHLDELECIDAALDEVSDDRHRLLVCRLASCIISANGHVTEIERSIYNHMLLRWGYTSSSVAQAVLAAHIH